MTPPDDEFYVGYEPVMPPATGRRVRIAVIAAAIAVVAVAGFVTAVQRPLAASSFAYGRSDAWSGHLVRTPAPAVLVPARGGFTRYWLVARGKHGAAAALEGLAEGWIEVRGSEITRDPWRMIEIASARAASPPAAVPPAPAAAVSDGRAVSLVGEIVDSKCFLGVMNPGERTVHRDCAIRCLSGGVTPMFLFADAAGAPQLAVIVDARGSMSPFGTHGHVGHSARLDGWLFTVDEVPVLRLDAAPGAEP